MRNRIKTTEPEAVDSIGTPFPPVQPEQLKQSIMYWTEDGAPDHLYTVAHLQDSTIDRIADRVVAKLDMRREKVVDLTGKKKRGKK